MTYGEFKSQIENTYKQRFPNSGISISLGALRGNTCIIRLYLGENRSEFINGIAENDILHVGFVIYQSENAYGNNPKLTDDSELPDTLIMEVRQNYIMTIPDGSTRLPYRKTKGSPEKIIQVFSKDIDILKQTLEDLYNEGKIHDNHKEIVEKKLGLSNVNESIEFRSKTKNLLECFQNNLKESNNNTKYIVCSYYDYKLYDLEDKLKTNDWTEATLFAHDKLMNGFMVEIENTITGKYKIINPDEYNEEFDGEFTIRPRELEESDSYGPTKADLVKKVNDLIKTYGRKNALWCLTHEFNNIGFYQEDKRHSKLNYILTCIDNCYRDGENTEDNRDIIRAIDNSARILSKK